MPRIPSRSSYLPNSYPASLTPSWPLNQNSSRHAISKHDENLHVEGFDNCFLAEFFDHELRDVMSDQDSAILNDLTHGSRLINDMNVQSVNQVW